MGHLSVGTNLDDGEKRMNDIGGLETVGVEKLTGQYDYWALGHIHRPQFVQGTGHRARYAGSPIALSFDEEYDHSVSIVSFDANKCVDVKTIAIDEPHKVTSIPKNPQSFDEALQLLKEYPADRQDYIRLNVWANGAPSDAMAIAQAEMNGKNSELLSINYVRDSEERKGTAVMSLSEFEDLSPLQVAKHIMRDSFSEEMEQTFMEVLASMDD